MSQVTGNRGQRARGKGSNPKTAKKRKLKSGFTTGACAAAVAKAATLSLLDGRRIRNIEIPFPNGDRHSFPIHFYANRNGQVMAATIKDAGDDPDVTNKAEIIAIVEKQGPGREYKSIIIDGGPGVGRVTKPGLAVAVGKPAINPVPEKMIRKAVLEAMAESGEEYHQLRISICISDGEKLAEKTLNKRLGIIGGLSILGTTGIVRPVSAKAWTSTIDASMKVARAAGLDEIILSTGRTSEAAVEKRLALPEEAGVMMGDYLAFSLNSAKRHGFKKIHLAGMWAKILKCALQVPQTHVRHGVLEVSRAADFLFQLGLDARTAADMKKANTAREIYLHLKERHHDNLIKSVCLKAKEYAKKCSHLEVEVYLVTSENGVVEHV